MTVYRRVVDEKGSWMDDQVVSMPAKVEVQIGFGRLRKLQTPIFA